MRWRSVLRCFAVVFAALLVCKGLHGQVDSPRTSSETIRVIPVEYYWRENPRLGGLWFPEESRRVIEIDKPRFESPQVQDRLAAAQIVIRLADEPELPKQEAFQIVIDRLRAGEKHPEVRRSLISAACSLADASALDELWKWSEGDASSLAVVESTCVRLGSSIPLDAWRRRIVDKDALDGPLMTACRGIGVVGTPRDVENLLPIVMEKTRAMPIRLAAAEACGRITDRDLLPEVQKLVKHRDAPIEFIVVRLLTQAGTPESIAFLKDFVDTASVAASRAAFEVLLKADSEWCRGVAVEQSHHADSAVRSECIKMLQGIDSSEAAACLLEMLGDTHPDLRNQARAALLHKLAMKEADPSSQSTDLPALINPAIVKALQSDDWRAVEQAIRLAMELKQIDHTSQLVQLLDHPRNEVNITAAWALRRSQPSPEIMEQMLRKAEVWTAEIEQAIRQKEPYPVPVYRRLGHMFETFGVMRYEPAAPLLNKYIPKVFGMGLITRMCAVTSLGRIYADRKMPELRTALEARIAEKNVMIPEPESLRFAATVALGLLGDAEAEPALVEFDETEKTPIHAATVWALERIRPKAEK
ncbi:MAG: HEAT repeat domain-containing protein [Pirellulales bacterium]